MVKLRACYNGFMPTFPLSEDQKRKLLELCTAAPELLTHRARLILAYAAGKPTLQAASEAGISRGRARYWKRQFIAKGMDIFELQVAAAIVGSETMRPLQGKGETHVTTDEYAHQAGCAESPDENPYPQPLASISIRPDDTLAEAGRKVWLYHFALMLSHEQGTLLGEDIEELHDMRVATRRMRTAFDVFGQAFDRNTLKHYLKGLRAVGGALGQVRDMDVILAHAIEYQNKLKEVKRPGLEPLILAWKQVIDKKRSKMARHLQDEDYLGFKTNFNRFLQAPDSAAPVSEYLAMSSHLRDIVPVLVYERYAAVRAYEPILSSASIAQLHALRIEFKKLRYVLEYFREILGESAGPAIAAIKQMQDHLGELHDTDVACSLVSEFLAGWEKKQCARPIPERENPEPIVTYLAYLNAERYRLVSSFPELWRKFNRPEFRQNIAQAISNL